MIDKEPPAGRKFWAGLNFATRENNAVRAVGWTESLLALTYICWRLKQGEMFFGIDLDFDEGFNLMKAALVRRGFHLYTEIWSDQPPLFTHALKWLWTFTEPSFNSARLLVLAFSGLLVWSVANFMRRAAGVPHAIAAAAILTQLPTFLKLSISAMIGIPSIAVGWFALCVLLQWHRSRSSVLLVLSAALTVISLFFKLFTVALVPVMASGIFFASRQMNIKAEADRATAAPKKELVLWSLWLGLIATAICFLFAGFDGISQMTIPHLKASSTSYFTDGPPFRLGYYLKWSLWILIIGATGALMAISQRRWFLLYPIGLAILNLVLLLWHRPVRYHQVILATVPIALLAGYFCGEVVRIAALLHGRRRNWALALDLCFIAALTSLGIWPVLWDSIVTGLPPPRFGKGKLPADQIQELVSELRRAGDSSEFVISDLPGYVFRAGLLAPPQLAVFSEKRMRSGALSEKDLIRYVEELHHPSVLLGRFEVPELRRYLKTHGYSSIRFPGGPELYTADAQRDVQSRDAWRDLLSKPQQWYQTTEARTTADRILDLQGPHGGWPKNYDMTIDHSKTELDAVKQGVGARHLETIDNGATCSEIRYLAKIYAATLDIRFRDAAVRGIRYLLSAQYPSGGWPQRLAPRGVQYPRMITFNDNAMINVLRLLRDAEKTAEFDFIGPELRLEISEARMRGLQMIVRSQIDVFGKKTGWCAEYQPDGVTPAGGRSYEPAAISGYESVEIVRYLMEEQSPGSEVIEAVNAAAAWFQASAIAGIRVVDRRLGPGNLVVDRHVEADPDGSRIWARFYDLHSNLPLFYDRDGNPRANYNDLSLERRIGYDYFTGAPEQLLVNDYPAWQAKIGRDR